MLSTFADILLHFDAVDYNARVWLNGRFLGEHRGGYTPFAFEVTDGIRNGDNELVVHAKPFLYDLTMETLRKGKVLDSVHSYCGLRKITIEGNRFLINDRPIFQRLILDQGFCPDGIYTAPSDEALRRDIELSLAAGFNGARFHQKVFDPRTLYWADKLGYLVWGEFPSWGVNIENEEAVRRFVDEWHQVVRRDRNHPSIIGWCPLNETATNEYVARLEDPLATTRTMDPTRPFLDSSGYTHFLPGTDVFDAHDYEQNPQAFAARYAAFGATGCDPWHNNPGDPRSRYRGQPFFVSEFGGIHVKTARDTGTGCSKARFRVSA